MLAVNKKNYFLKDISNFSQFTIKFPHSDKIKLITLVGEYHNEEIACNEPELKKIITIADYIKETSQNINKKVILEYDRFLCGPESIAECSLNIKYILEDISPHKYKHIKKVAMDFRTQFLGVKNQYILYKNSDVLKEYTKRDILSTYIDTFFSQISEKSKFLKGEKYNKFVSILFSDYLVKINSQIENIGRIVVDKWDKMTDNDKNDVIFSIKKVWADLSDYYIIREFFKEEDVEEYIVIVGKNHHSNICEYLKNLPSILPTNIGLNFTYVVNKKTSVDINGKINCITTENTLEYTDYITCYELNKPY